MEETKQSEAKRNGAKQNVVIVNSAISPGPNDSTNCVACVFLKRGK